MKDVMHPPLSEGHPTPQEFIDELPLPYVELNRKGFVTRANKACEALHPSEHGLLIGRLAWEAMASDEMASSFEGFCELLRTGGTPAVVRRNIFVSTGQFRTFELHRSLILDAHGKPDGMRVLAVDVTESVKALESTRTAALWLHSVLDSIPEPVLVADAMGQIRQVNPAAESFFGWLPNSVYGKLVEQALPISVHALPPEPKLDFQQALEAPCSSRMTLLDGFGSPILVDMACSPVLDTQSGHLAGVVCVLHRVGSAN